MLFLIDHFLPDLSDTEVDIILEEWQTFRFSKDLPASDDSCDVDWWRLEVLELKSPTGSCLFRSLRGLLKTVLILPCDQAPVERVFLMVK